MNKKEIESKLQNHHSDIKFLNAEQHRLCKKYCDLERRIDRIEERLKNQESITCEIKIPDLFSKHTPYSKLEEPPFVAIRAKGFSRNKCPHCGSHDLFVKVYHGDIPTEWTCQECGKRFSSHEVAHDDKTAFEQIEELKDVNKKLGNEIDDLVHKYDTMNRRYLDAYDNYRDVQDKLDDARDRIKLQNSKIDLLDNKNKKLEKAAEDAAKLTEENKELIKVLNIYQAITDIDYDFLTDTAMVRLNGADGAGRVFVHDGDAARALFSASIRYHDNSFKYKH